MKNWTYIRTDKNGTKIYHDYSCQRCGGHGGSDAWIYTGWTCYECGGTGKSDRPQVIKEYTPEYRAKLDAQAEKRRQKKMALERENDIDYCDECDHCIIVRNAGYCKIDGKLLHPLLFTRGQGKGPARQCKKRRKHHGT